MKNILKSVFALLCMSSVLFSCQKEAPEVVLTVDKTEITAEAQKPIDVSVAVTSNSTWILTTPKWVEASVSYGSGNAIITFKISPNYKNATTSQEARSGEIKLSAGGSLTGKAVNVTIIVNQQGYTYIDPNPSLGGIDSVEEFVKFAQAVNDGGSLRRWSDDSGNILLLANINLSGVTSWTPIGTAVATGAPAYNNDNAFTGVFDGQGFSITGISWTFNLEGAENHTYGLFGAVKDATIKNLVLGKEGDKITLVGSTDKIIAVGALLGYAENSEITNITNNVDIELASKDAAVPGDNKSGKLMMLGGIAGNIKSPMTFGIAGAPIINNGDVKTGKISNLGNGGTGMNVGGIVAYTSAVTDKELNISYCENYGEVSAPTGRGGGLIGTLGGETGEAAKTSVKNCKNAGLVQDDVVGQLVEDDKPYDRKRMGGLVGGTVTSTGIVVEDCVNAGNVFSQVGCRTGGFIGHCQVFIKNCTNTGIILAKDSPEGHGAGWACGLNGKKEQIVGCTKGGRVGDWDTYKDNPEGAPAASDDNACAYMNSERYDPAANN